MPRLSIEIAITSKLLQYEDGDGTELTWQHHKSLVRGANPLLRFLRDANVSKFQNKLAKLGRRGRWAEKENVAFGEKCTLLWGSTHQHLCPIHATRNDTFILLFPCFYVISRTNRFSRTEVQNDIFILRCLRLTCVQQHCQN